MPTDRERELLAFAEAERRRSSLVSSSAPTELPPLTEDMLMSAGARREMVAAQQHFRVGQFPRARRVEQRRVVAEMDLEDLAEEDSQEAPFFSEDALQNLFMGREAREAAQAIDAAVVSGFDVEFDQDSTEGRTSPNERVRFQIGRQSPPRIPFSASRVEGPSDGVVVSNRNNNGRWAQTSAGSLAGLPAPAQNPRPKVETPKAAVLARSQIPSVYQRILQGGVVDDD